MKKIKLLGLGMLLICFVQCSQNDNRFNYPKEEVEPVMEAADEDYEDYEEDEDEETITEFKKPDEVFYSQREIDPKFKDRYTGKKYDYDRVVNPPDIRLPKFQFSVWLIKVLMYGIIGILALVVIYYIIKNAGGFSFGNSRNKIKVKTSAEEDILDDENIENNDFEALIKTAKAEKDYRKATRYYYLWILQTLSDKNLIKWNRDKTNFDYLNELAQHPVHQEFSYNTFLYDYVWYGKFPMNEQEFQLAENKFKQTINRIR